MSAERREDSLQLQRWDSLTELGRGGVTEHQKGLHYGRCSCRLPLSGVHLSEERHDRVDVEGGALRLLRGLRRTTGQHLL